MTVIWLVVASMVAVALAFARLLAGPTQADRVIALDIISAASVALAAAAALATGRALFLDVAIGFAIVGFVATIAWARLIEQTSSEEDW
jgi:multicomponent Na+:H+ antiporter subunit F